MISISGIGFEVRASRAAKRTRRAPSGITGLGGVTTSSSLTSSSAGFGAATESSATSTSGASGASGTSGAVATGFFCSVTGGAGVAGGGFFAL